MDCLLVKLFSKKSLPMMKITDLYVMLPPAKIFRSDCVDFCKGFVELSSSSVILCFS